MRSWNWRSKGASGAVSARRGSGALRPAESSFTSGCTTSFSQEFSRRVKALRVGDGADRWYPDGTVDQRIAACYRDEVRRDRRTGGSDAASSAGTGWRAARTHAAGFTNRRSLPTSTFDADRARGNLRAGRLRDALPLAGRSHRDWQRCRVWLVRVHLHTRHQQGALPRCATCTPESST